MIISILDERNKLLSYPLRAFGPWIQDTLESDNPRIAYSGMAIIAMAFVPTFVGNVLLPAKMIEMGLRPRPVLEGITYAKSALGYPMPVWNMFHGASPAYKTGARVAGKVGGRVGARLIPGVGWALLAYDVYDIAYNRSLWGFDF
jgi:hypothetical protein